APERRRARADRGRAPARAGRHAGRGDARRRVSLAHRRRLGSAHHARRRADRRVVPMSGLLLLGRLARADFLERIRRHSFLVTLGFTVFSGYMFLPPNHSTYATLNLSGHRGIYNSAWVGSLVAMLSVTFLALAGFYLVKNAVEHDRRT